MWHWRICSSQFQVMAYHLFGAKPLCEPMAYCQFIPQEHTSVKFETKYKPFIQRNAFENATCKMSAISLRPSCVNSSPPSATYMCQDCIGSDNGLSPIRRQAIIWTSAGLLSIGPLRTNSSEIFIKIQNFSFKKMHLKISSSKRQPFYPGRDELTGGSWVTA